MTFDKLRKMLADLPVYRTRQAADAVFKMGAASFDEITALPRSIRGRLKATPVLSMELESLRMSKDGLAHKAVLRLGDGKRIETVLMRPKPGLWTACISSQVGCALACSFCATGLMGFDRNLAAEEITDQVLFWRQYLRSQGCGEKLSNIVYMGMGEPFLNLDNVTTSLKWLSDPEQFGIGQRHLSVSTVGIVPGMERFAKTFSQVNLALSLHAATPELRTKLVPANKTHSLDRLKRALQLYFKNNNRKVFIEYVLLKGVNDRSEDAEALVRFLRSVAPPQLLHVNLIVWNPTNTSHSPTSREAAKKFFNVLRRANQPATFRKNLGADIEGACGQLVLQER